MIISVCSWKVSETLLEDSTWFFLLIEGRIWTRRCACGRRRVSSSCGWGLYWSWRRGRWAGGLKWWRCRPSRPRSRRTSTTRAGWLCALHHSAAAWTMLMRPDDAWKTHCGARRPVRAPSVRRLTGATSKPPGTRVAAPETWTRTILQVFTGNYWLFCKDLVCIGIFHPFNVHWGRVVV